MAELAQTDSTIAARHDLYQFRTVEELYDIASDPDCLVNLVGSPRYQSELKRLRGELETWMVRTDDHMLAVFQQRDDPAVREAYVVQKEKQSEERKAKKKQAKKAAVKKRSDLIALQIPKSIATGAPLVVKVRHTVPDELGTQKIHVTLKAGNAGKRVDRQVVEVSGEGVVEITFTVPASVPDDSVRIAAFIGPDYDRHLQHLQTQPKSLR
jgi:hypothetical protein